MKGKACRHDLWSLQHWKLWVLLGGATCACREPQGPCPGVVEGAQVRIEVVAPAGISTGELVCATGWGLAPGSVFEGEIVDTESRDMCQAGVLDTTGPGDTYAWELDSDATVYGRHTLESVFQLRGEDCEATMHLLLMGDLDNPDCDLKTGDDCLLRLNITRTAGTTEEGCPEGCSMHLNVTASYYE